jgi:hypothetical protein
MGYENVGGLKKLAALGALSLQMVFTGAAVANDDAPQAENANDHRTTNISSAVNDNSSTLGEIGDDLFVPADDNSLRLDRIIAVTETTSVPDLLEEFGTAADADSACLAGAIPDLMQDLQTNDGMTESEAAVWIINSLKPQQIRDLPTNARTDLISAVSENSTMTWGEARALKKMYVNSVEDPSFGLWDAERQVELSKALRDDPVLMDAKTNWSTMSDSDKLVALKRAQELTIKTFGAEFGVTPVPLSFMNFPSNPNIAGMYSLDLREMFLNLDSPMIPEDFDMTMVVTVHEALHAFHHQVSDMYVAGTLDKDHPIYEYAGFMTEGNKRYVTYDYDVYQANPTEKHAWEISYMEDYVGAGPGKSILEAEWALERAKERHEQFTEGRAKAKNGADNDGSCEAIILRDNIAPGDAPGFSPK